VPAALLTAVDSTRMHPGIALAADQLVLLVLTSQCQQRWVNNSSSQTQHQVQGGLLLDVVVLQGAAILELLASKDKTLLVRRDSCGRLLESETGALRSRTQNTEYHWNKARND